MADEPARDFGRIKDARTLRAQLARTEPRHRPFAGLAPDDFRCFQIARIARRAVPVVALHVVAGLGQQHAAHAVAGRGIAGEESMRIAVHAHASVTAHRRAFGVGDARVHYPPGRFAGARQLDRLLRRDVPGMVEIQVRDVARELVGIGQPGTLVLGGIARDIAGLLHGFRNRACRQVGGARRALALAEVDGNAHAAVALVLHGLDFTEAYRGCETLLQADVGLGLTGAEL